MFSRQVSFSKTSCVVFTVAFANGSFHVGLYLLNFVAKYIVNYVDLIGLNYCNNFKH